jgi:hypothetical protein
MKGWTLAIAVGSSLMAATAYSETEWAERWNAPIAHLAQMVQAAPSAEALAETFSSKNARIFTFHLEALLRMYEKHYPELREPHDRIKALEDRLGAYVDTSERIKFAEASHADSLTLTRLKAEHEAARGAFSTYLAKQGWTKDSSFSALDLIQEAIDRVTPPTAKQDEKWIREALQDQLDRTQKDFDMTQLQGNSGLHELRRQMRWFLLTVQALHGKVLLDEHDVYSVKGKPKEKLRAFLDHPMAQSPYVTTVVPVSGVKPLFKIPKWAFIQLTELTEDLGTVKELAEAAEDWLSEAVAAAHPDWSRKQVWRYVKDRVKAHPKFTALLGEDEKYKALFARSEEIKDAIDGKHLVPILSATVRGKRKCPLGKLNE